MRIVFSYSESDLQMLGFRMYDNETGRFTTPDLLWSAFPAHTPYHYAYNSPLTYRDPTGLAPEKEKEREELMGVFENQFAVSQKLEDNLERESLINNPLYNPLGVSPFALAFGVGGGGSRIGVAGAGYNGAYKTMELNVPKNWDTESINEVCKPANNYLNQIQTDFPNKEVGFLLRYDSESNRLFADFFIGESETKWLGLYKSPYNKPLKSSEMIIGFVHTHPRDKSSTFSPDDLSVISDFSLGNYKWTNVPNMADFTIERGWKDNLIPESTKVLHNNPKTIDRMYFGVHYSEGYDSFSWQSTYKKYLPIMYNNIWIMKGINQYLKFLKEPKSFGADYHNGSK
ncbi:MAG: hypothetical protein KF896_03355 [Ignavibacteriae bacterium]|nr:hypothetical protein [Ignavibacteriota bacterium]